MRNLTLAFCLLSVVFSVCVHGNDKSDERFSFSGFGRVVGGLLNEEHARYEGYDDSISFSEQSLLGIQAEYTLTNSLTVAAQGLLHTSDTRDSGVEWLYLNYTPSPYFQLKVGKLRTPFFNYSDVLDVGFAYRWITPPQQIYSTYFPSNYNGVSAIVRVPTDNFSTSIEGYWGEMDADIYVRDLDVAFDVGAQYGVIFSVERGALRLRASAHHSDDATVSFEQGATLISALRRAGFRRSADTLNTNGKGKEYQVGFSWEDTELYIAGEWIVINTDLLSGLNMDAAYLTVGYNFSPAQVYLTVAKSNSKHEQPANEIPIGIDPGLDRLADAYDQLFSEASFDNLTSYSLGVRWELDLNKAVKVEWTLLDGKAGQRAYFDVIDHDAFDRHASLYQVALEWVF